MQRSKPGRAGMSIHRHATPPRHAAGMGLADAGVLLTVVQVCVCMVVLVVLFTLQYIAPQRFDAAGVLYRAVMSGGEGEAVFVGAFGTPVTKLMEQYAQDVWEQLPLPEGTLRVEKPLPNSGRSLLGQGGGGGAAPQNVYLGPVALMAAPGYPVYGVVTSPFGLREHPISRKEDFHTGLDIAAPLGAGIYAALPGRVEEVGQSPIYGNYIKLSHGAKLATVYNHCSVILAEPGAVVRRGERIAQVGSTGVATGPHLHFDLLVEGRYADPLQIFRFPAEGAEETDG